MGEVNLRRDYLVYTCESERFDESVYFPKFENNRCFIRCALWIFLLALSCVLLARLNIFVLWVVYGLVIVCLFSIYVYYGHLRAVWLNQGVVYEVTNNKIRSMTSSGQWLSECSYKNKSIKIIPLANGFSEVHIRNKRIEKKACWNLFFPPDIGEFPCVFVMYQISNAEYFVSLMINNEFPELSE